MLLTKTSSAKHERTVKIGKDKKKLKKLKEHVLVHHIGLDLTSFEGAPSTQEWLLKVDAMIG